MKQKIFFKKIKKLMWSKFNYNNNNIYIYIFNNDGQIRQVYRIIYQIIKW